MYDEDVDVDDDDDDVKDEEDDDVNEFNSVELCDDEGGSCGCGSVI